MKKLNNIQRAQNYLVKVVKYILEEYDLAEEIEVPTVTIQSTPGALAHVSINKVWFNGETATHELNISSDYMTRDCTEIVASIEHELTHLLAMSRNIKDTSGSAHAYHNANFKKLAEETFGLQIERHEKYGWTITIPTMETVEFCIKYGLEDILIGRTNGFPAFPISGGKSGNGSGMTVTPKKSNSIRWQCPKCGAIVRSTKEVRICCMDCNTPFVRTN